jgi:hypothetical protein
MSGEFFQISLIHHETLYFFFKLPTASKIPRESIDDIKKLQKKKYYIIAIVRKEKKERSTFSYSRTHSIEIAIKESFFSKEEETTSDNEVYEME